MSGRAAARQGAAARRCAAAAALLLAAAPDSAPAQDPATASSRVRFTINERWRYADGPTADGPTADGPTTGAPAVGAPDTTAGAESPDFADGGWSTVDLPHTWNAMDAFARSAGYRRGVGWYRRRLALDASLRGRRLFLHFEGANQTAEVWVDGREAGGHVGGYTAFAFDVTDLVRWDGPNVIAVRVDNAHDPDVPPLNGDWTFYGGIYRDVWLVATDPLHVTLLDHASPGIRVDTPTASAERATVRVRGTLVNATGAERRADVVHRVLDDAGREVAAVRHTVAVPARGEAAFDRTSAPIASPRLWSPAAPNLYTVRTEVRDGDRVADMVDVPLGVRWIAVDAQRGVLLNGQPVPLAGTNRHQDRAGYGNALPNWAHRDDVRIVKETGFDFLRLAHYPQDPAVLEATDREGLAVWEEIPVVNLIAMSDAFADNAERMLVEMIRQHYNHPSVVLWGYMNEVMLTRPDPVPPGYHERIVALARRLEKVVVREDPTRLSATAISFDEIDNGTGFQDIPDVLGLNLYFGWYYRTLDGLGPWLDSLHARHPTRPILVSEYGAGSDERIHAREPRAFDFSTEHQRRFHEATWPQLAARPWLAGTAVWNQFDFGSKGRHDSKPGVNQKGLLYLDRTPKDVWHLYRAMLRDDIPVLHLAVRDDSLRAGSSVADAVQSIAVYTNLGAVELFAGARSLGVRAPADGVARWEVTLRAGANRLRARGAADGAPVEDAATVHYADRRAFFAEPGDAPDAPDSMREMAVNAGAAYAYVDAGGTVWEADRAYAPGGAWGHLGGTDVLTHHRVSGSVEDALFQASRDGAQGYRFDVPDGIYEVRVGVAETRHDSAGARVFDVAVNGAPLFGALDLAAEYGRHAAVERTAVVAATGGGGIAITFAARVGQPTVSAIHLRRQSRATRSMSEQTDDAARARSAGGRR